MRMLSSILPRDMHRFFAPATLIAALVLSAAVMAAPVVKLLDGRCEITPPEGWRTDATYGDAGVVLQPPDPRAWPVEIAAWAAPDGAEQTPEAAAAAHEAMLRREYAYSRISTEPIFAGDDLEGLLVTGTIATDAGEATSVFAAFSRAGRYYVAGTFALPDTAGRTIERHLRPVLSGLEIRNGSLQPPEDTPDNPEPNEPADQPVPPDLPTPPGHEPPGIPAAVGPTAPPVNPQYDTAPAEARTEQASDEPLFDLHESGLSIRAPANWTIEMTDGRWTVHPQGMEQKALGVLIWPLSTLRSGMAAEDIAREALRHWDPTAGYDLQIRPEGDSGAVFSGVGLGAGGPLRILGRCDAAGDRALISAIYVTSERSGDDWPMLAEILASARVEAFAYTEPHFAPPSYEWTLPGVAEVTLQVPEGFRVRGDLDRGNQVDALSIESVDPGVDRTYVSLYQPVTPLFKGLSQLLVGLGYDSGDEYESEATGRGYTLLSRMDPEQFVLDYWSRESRISLSAPEIVKSEASRGARRLLTSADAAGRYIIVEGDSRLGPRRHHYLVATGSINTGDVGTWQAAVIEAAAPKSAETRALAAARVLLESADITPSGSASQIAAANLLRRAAEAVADFPESAPAPMGEIYSPLAHAADGRRRWNRPESPAGMWDELVDCVSEDRDVARVCPEVGLMTASPAAPATQ